MWKKIQIKEIYWCWQKYIIQKNETKQTQQKQNQKPPPNPGGPWSTDSKQPREPLRTSHLIHEDLHLHQPRVGIPRCPVGYHPSKGDQGSGLAAELLRERGRREGTQLSFGSGHCPGNQHSILPFSPLGGVMTDSQWVDDRLALHYHVPPVWCRVSKGGPPGPQFQSPFT